MNRKEFEKWVGSRLDNFAQVLPEKRRPWVEMGVTLYKREVDVPDSAYVNVYIGNFFINCNLTTRETTIFNTNTKHSATAKCRIEEKFDVCIGVAIAWAKYNHEVIPSYKNFISREELVNGNKFTNRLNRNRVWTFVGWLPNTKDGLVGKWAIALDNNHNPIKVQVTREVVIVE